MRNCLIKLLNYFQRVHIDNTNTQEIMKKALWHESIIHLILGHLREIHT